MQVPTVGYIPDKGCPFCGRLGKLVEWVGTEQTHWFVWCPPCDIVGPWSLTPWGAVIKWNTRPLEGSSVPIE